MEQDLKFNAKYPPIVLDHQITKLSYGTIGQNVGPKVNFDNLKANKSRHTTLHYSVWCITSNLILQWLISRNKTPDIIFLVKQKTGYNEPKITESDDKDGLSSHSPGALVQSSRKAKQPLRPSHRQSCHHLK